MGKEIIKNCATCWWSRRDCETLTLYCYQQVGQQLEIKNGIEDAQKCDAYSFEKPKNTQLKLFT